MILKKSKKEVNVVIFKKRVVIYFWKVGDVF